MKLIFAALSLLAVAFALSGDRTRNDRRPELVDPRNVESFRPGQSYRFMLDSQISSGMATVSEQHAVTRLQAEVVMQFHSERQVTLRLQEVQTGSLNKEINHPEKVQPIEMFKVHEIKAEDSKTLELPVTFDYAQGLVENIRFHQDDDAWSKNIKKSVLNMLQLNLKQRTGAKVQLEKLPEWTKDYQSEYEKNENEPKLFVLPEITLEGECQTTYTINKMSPRDNKFNSYYDQEMSRDSPSDSSVRMFNVTKSIDFTKCQKIADIRYGPKIEKPCNNCTSPEELEEQKLERSTIIRHVVVGTPDKYGIQKVELVSHYLFKLLNVEEEKPMHTIVAGELTYMAKESVRSRREEEREIRPVQSTAGKEETLLYSTEWDEQEKLFFMYGDEEFPQQSPFKYLTQKVDKIEKTMNKLVTLWSDKTKGIETEATMIFHKLVEYLRMCKESELKQVFDLFTKQSSGRLSEPDMLRAEELLVDAMSNAGTYNTIKVLVEKILRREITTYRAVRVLSQLKDLPAPSEKQVEQLTRLCQNEVCSRFQSCKQTCWLTAGAIMGELCNEELTVEDSVEQKKGPFCQSDMKKKFIKTIFTQYEKVETRYERILLLKAIGNAGLDLSVFDLEKIIRDIREEPLVRMQAIDSLRRLRAVMPEKIQRVLMPIFQDVKERPEIRMSCVAQILATIPEKHILDEISYTLIRDPSRQVKSYVYTAMKSLSESSVRPEKELAQHLKALLKMAGITEEDEEELLRGSRYYRVPVYSKAKKEGFFMDFESMVGPDNVLPKHLHAGIDSFINNVFKKTNVEISFTQDDLEQWYENIMTAFMDYYYAGSSSRSGKQQSQKPTRAHRNSRENSEEEPESIFKSLSVKRRSNRAENDKSSPFGMLAFRMGDIDYAILPFEEEMLYEPLKKIVTKGERPSLRDFEKLIEYFQGRPFRVHGAINLIENSVKIPTSMGLPIRMLHVLPILASVEGTIKPEFRGSEIKLDIQLHPSLTTTHMKRVEVWLPFLTTGVESSRTVALNIPFKSQLAIKLNEQPKTFKWTVQVPEHKHRLISVHSLPLTFVTELENWVPTRMPAVKSIENQQLINRARHIEKTYGQQNFELPLKIVGEVHWPNRMTYEELIHLVFTSENHMQVDFLPTQESPREIVLSGAAQLFDQQQQERTQHRELKQFYQKSKFDSEEDQHYESREENSNSGEQLDSFLDSYEPKKMLKHVANLHLQTIGGRKDKSARMEIEGACDEKLRFCKAELNIKRSQMNEESRDWTLKTQMQCLMPEYLNDYSDYSESERSNSKSRSEKQQKFVSQMEVEWGCDRKQTLKMNVNGEQVRSKEWSEKINKIEKRFDAPKIREQMNRKVSFLNKYDISVQFGHLEPSTINFAHWSSTMLKNWNWWNTQVTLKDSNSRGEKQITATLVIDPITHEHMNVTIKTPMEIIRITPMSLPMKIKPFKLVKPHQQSIESFTDLVSNYATESRPECKVDSRRVNTFDDVTFKAPITKCYTVLAKDCASERPRFAVLMKKISGQDKKIKVIINEDVIEVEPKSSHKNKLEVTINGRVEQDYDTLRQYGVEYNTDMIRISNKDITVRFDGEQAWVKISPFFKNRQCGLCGNYDDNTEDEYRMADNEFSSDIKSFHKSYSLQDEECRPDFEETHRREEFKPITDSRENYERDEEYTQRRSRTNENHETEPVERTEVMEHSHKICFSIKPVKTCPEGSYAKETKEHKTSFTCYDRTSTEARRLLRQARRDNEPIEVPSDKASFVQQLRVPTTCAVY